MDIKYIKTSRTNSKYRLSSMQLLFLRCLGIVAFSSTMLGFVFPVNASEKVIFKYGMWQESLPVSDMTVFCDTGEISTTLSYYIRLSNQSSDRINNVLCKPIAVNGVTLSKMLNNPVGGFILDLFGEVITTPSKKASRESLRGALVTSALENDDISIIEVLNNYPTNEVHLNGDRLVEFYRQVEDVLKIIPVNL